VTARSQVWVGTQFPLRLDYGRSPHAYINQRLQIQLGLLMMSDIPLETYWAFNKLRNNKFRYQAPCCWLLLLNYYDARIHEYKISSSSYRRFPHYYATPYICPRCERKYVYIAIIWLLPSTVRRVDELRPLWANNHSV